MFCTQCGERLASEFKFCSACGARVVMPDQGAPGAESNTSRRAEGRIEPTWGPVDPSLREPMAGRSSASGEKDRADGHQLSMLSFVGINVAIPLAVVLALPALGTFIGHALGLSAVGFVIGRFAAGNHSRRWLGIGMFQSILVINTVASIAAVQRERNWALLIAGVAFLLSWALHRLAK